MNHSSLLAALFVLFALPVSSQEIVVPTDAPDLETALARAQSGDTILVRTTNVQSGDGPLVVSVPLTIIGDPICNIQTPSGRTTLQLNGPGSGTVTIANASLGTHFGHTGISTGIAGGGFEELHLVETDILLRKEYDGQAYRRGVGLVVDVERIVLEGCLVEGAHGGSDGYYGPETMDGSPAIEAPGATVLLFDTIVLGGSGSPYNEEGCVNCECTRLSNWGARGAAAIIARDVFAMNSTVQGGRGAWIVAYSDGQSPVFPSGTRTVCGKRPDGPKLIATGTVDVAESHALRPRHAQVRVGEEWTVDWATTGKVASVRRERALVLLSSRLREPVRTPQGWLFLDSHSLLPAFAVDAAYPSASIGVDIPSDPALVGRSVYMQLATDGWLTWPVSCTLVL